MRIRYHAVIRGTAAAGIIIGLIIGFAIGYLLR